MSLLLRPCCLDGQPVAKALRGRARNSLAAPRRHGFSSRVCWRTVQHTYSFVNGGPTNEIGRREKKKIAPLPNAHTAGVGVPRRCLQGKLHFKHELFACRPCRCTSIVFMGALAPSAAPNPPHAVRCPDIVKHDACVEYTDIYSCPLGRRVTTTSSGAEPRGERALLHEGS